MKKFFFIIFLSLNFLTYLSAQNIQVADQAGQNILPFYLTTDLSSRMTSPFALPNTPKAAFLSVAVFTTKKFNGNLYYKTPDTNWTLLHRYHEATHPEREIFELINLPIGTQNIEFKSDQQLPGSLHLRWFAPIRQEHFQSTTANTRIEDCDCPQPEICGRACWCPSGNCPQDATPTATTPSHIIVHHSAAHSTSNDFSAVVRSYWDFHVNVNGWDDIGYNWLVDGNGVIYEGRGSGNRGAHFSCMNAETTGICMIGNFETATPTEDALESLEELITWESCDKMITPQDSSVHVTAQVPLAHISGHRDGNNLPNSCTNTVCPGANLYPLLPAIRSQVADQACLQLVTAVSSVLHEKTLLFPNPNTGIFYVTNNQTPVHSISVLTSGGKEVFEYKKQDTITEGDINETIPLSIEVSGLYFVKIRLTDGTLLVKRVVVK